MSRLLKVAGAIQSENPGRRVVVDTSAAVIGIDHHETGDLVPFIAATITGEILPYHGVLVNGNAPVFNWQPIEDAMRAAIKSILHEDTTP